MKVPHRRSPGFVGRSTLPLWLGGMALLSFPWRMLLGKAQAKSRSHTPKRGKRTRRHFTRPIDSVASLATTP